MYGGVGHCIYSTLVYMARGGGRKGGGWDVEGEGCAQPGGFWGIQLFIRHPSDSNREEGYYEGKVGY